MSLDLNNLPVPPEFVETLLDTVHKTTTDYLEALHVPQDAIELVNHLASLAYYLEEAYRDPAYMARERNDRFDIEAVTLESLSLVARCGGSFQGPWNDTAPRPLPVRIPVKVRK